MNIFTANNSREKEVFIGALHNRAARLKTIKSISKINEAVFARNEVTKQSATLSEKQNRDCSAFKNPAKKRIMVREAESKKRDFTACPPHIQRAMTGVRNDILEYY